MRPSLLRSLSLSSGLLWGCGGGGGTAPSFVPDFVDRSSAAACEATEPPGGVLRSVAGVRSAGDSALVVLHEAERVVALYDAGGRERARVRYRKEGPLRVAEPRDAAWHGGTFYLADRGGRRIKMLGADGGDGGEIDLPFAPERVAVTGSGIAIVPLVLGAGETELLYLWRDGELRPAGVPVARVGDWRLAAMANQASLVPFPDGRVVVAHQFIVPGAHVVAPGGGVSELSLPLPDGLRSGFGRLPRPPFTEEELQELPAPLLDAAADRRSGDLLFLTRSGRRSGDHHEKAVIRADRDFRYLRSYLLPMNGGFIGYFSSSRSAWIVDDDDRWHRCELP